ncbi:DUF2071 domain-containing protein [Chitinophaga varians]|uniref:DUF2071 domain-containing protein n=1 Tax=Chitinophaga varians TaxID=2202339 RepID=UPI00165F5E15|nr:DUF2071 domain-containing protein [Chitinophaga varians]MBC9913504.1 DUF2071 domain-containing protein [Chitinophaga varians]
MLTLLKNHPFAVEAYFESSLVLTYAVPEAMLRPLVPAKLELELFDHQWAFIAVAVVQTRHLRPKGFPEFMGHDFVLTGYRVFVRYTNSQGKKLRGLYILKSETDKRKMEMLGNLFTRYRYTTTDIEVENGADFIHVTSVKSGMDVAVDLTDPDAALPAGSPFNNWKEARRFAGPLPFTFTCNDMSDKVLIIEGVRENWTPRPVAVVAAKVDFMNRPEWKDAVLANAFLIQHIPYYWKKGKVDIWKG